MLKFFISTLVIFISQAHADTIDDFRKSFADELARAQSRFEQAAFPHANFAINDRAFYQQRFYG